jgi:hypothetical protein
VGPRVGLDAVERENLARPGIEAGPSSPSLYRLSYPDSPLLSLVPNSIGTSTVVLTERRHMRQAMDSGY